MRWEHYHTPVRVMLTYWLLSAMLLLSCEWFTFRGMFLSRFHGLSRGTGNLHEVEGKEQRVTEMPHPQAAAVANLLLSHCFHGNSGAMLLSCKVEWWYTRWGEGLGRRSRWWVERKGNTVRKGCYGIQGEFRGGPLLLLEQQEHKAAKRICLLAFASMDSI